MKADRTNPTHRTDRLLVLAIGLIGVAVLGLLAVTAWQAIRLAQL